MILDNECIAEVADKLTSAMFPDYYHRQLFDVIVSLNDSSIAVDNLTIEAKMGENWSATLYVDVAESVPHAASVGYYSDIVLESHRKAEVLSLADDLERVAKMDIDSSEMVTLVNPWQLANATSPILPTLPGIVTLVSPSQSENAPSPMLVTEVGMVTLVSPLQSWNARSPMEVTPSEIVTLVSPLQSQNALSPMLVTLGGIVTLVSPLHPRKTWLSILVTLSGIVTLSNPLQLLNAEPPMLATLGGIVTLVSPAQSWNA